jgi:DNA invertase Pin-like site-specific DNA recombinase
MVKNAGSKTLDSDPSDDRASTSRHDTGTEGATNPVVAMSPQPLSFDRRAGQRLGYIRVSTKEQLIDRQRDALEPICDRLFIDHGYSGMLDSRPELDRLLDMARAGDTVVIHSLDRLGRRAGQLLTWVDELHARDCSLQIVTLDVDSRSVMGKLVLGVCASLAEAEREQLSARVRHGLEAARARGRVGGRPPALIASQRQAAREMVATGKTAREVGAILGCSERTVRRVVAAVSE